MHTYAYWIYPGQGRQPGGCLSSSLPLPVCGVFALLSIYLNFTRAATTNARTVRRAACHELRSLIGVDFVVSKYNDDDVLLRPSAKLFDYCGLFLAFAGLDDCLAFG